MAINDINVLPKFIQEIPQMKDLLQAEQNEIYNIYEYIDSMLDELNINTCEQFISRYEKILGIKQNSNNLEVRKTQVIAKLLGTGVTSKKSIEELALMITNVKCRVDEKPEDNSFTVNFDGGFGSTIEQFITQLDELKPAHLNYRIQGEVNISNNIYIGGSVVQCTIVSIST